MTARRSSAPTCTPSIPPSSGSPAMRPRSWRSPPTSAWRRAACRYPGATTPWITPRCCSCWMPARASPRFSRRPSRCRRWRRTCAGPRRIYERDRCRRRALAAVHRPAVPAAAALALAPRVPHHAQPRAAHQERPHRGLREPLPPGPERGRGARSAQVRELQRLLHARAARAGAPLRSGPGAAHLPGRRQREPDRPPGGLLAGAGQGPRLHARVAAGGQHGHGVARGGDAARPARGRRAAARRRARAAHSGKGRGARPLQHGLHRHRAAASRRQRVAARTRAGRQRAGRSGAGAAHMSGGGDWRPSASRERLIERAALLSRAREFFAARGVLEVDTPLLVNAPVSDVHIHCAAVQLDPASAAAEPPGASSVLFLHASPEYAMKRLLAAGSGDIYQICHVVRARENGRLHNPEFTLIEWYRLGFSLEALMDEVEALVRELLGPVGEQRASERISYRDAFTRELALDPFTASDAELAQAGRPLGFARAGARRHARRALLMGLLPRARRGRGARGFVPRDPAPPA